MPSKSQQLPISPPSIDPDFVRFQIEQSLETFRTQYSLFMQGLGLLVVGNITVVGYAVSIQSSGTLFIGFMFPCGMLYIMDRAKKLMLPVIYTAVNLEHQFGGENVDWLASTFVSVTSSFDTINMMKQIGKEQNYEEKIKMLRRLNISLGGIDGAFSKVWVILLVIVQLIIPIFLNIFLKWKLF